MWKLGGRCLDGGRRIRVGEIEERKNKTTRPGEGGIKNGRISVISLRKKRLKKGQASVFGGGKKKKHVMEKEMRGETFQRGPSMPE